MKKNLFIAGAVAAALLYVSCASVPKNQKDPYYADNIGDFTKTTLSNGIPVIIKKNSASRICVVQLVIDGGAPLVKPSLGGLESVTLNLMLHGSQSYPYAAIQKLSYDESASFSSSASKDYSVIGFQCIDKSFDAVYPVFADSILNPLFSDKDFKTIMTEEADGVQSTLTDPSSLLIKTVKQYAYQDSPYGSPVDVTAETIGNITLDAVRAHYAELMNASRLSFVIVGNFDPDQSKDLVARLQKSFGSIPKSSFSRPVVPPITVSGDPVYVPCETAGTTGYLAGYFACPNRNDADYVPFAIATMFLDDQLFAQVREQHGAVYTIGMGVLSGRRTLGLISVYKATEQEHLKEYIEGAVTAFPDEKGVAEKLDQYKNKYITTLFESSQNAAGVAANIVLSLEYYGNPEQYLERAAQVRAVTAQQVETAYRTYISQKAGTEESAKSNPVRWVVVSNAATVNKFKM